MTSSNNTYQPLSDTEIQDIHNTVLKLLEDIGMGNPSPSFTEVALAAGCNLSDQDRLCIPASLVEDVIARVKRVDIRRGRDPERSIDLTEGPVLYGHSGFAPRVVDFNTGNYRDALLVDLYDMTRLIDQLEFVGLPQDSIVLTDVPDSLEQDLNKAYTLTAATTKPFAISFLNPDNITPVVSMFDMLMGGEERFKQTPFCHVPAVTTLSPLRYEDLQSSILIEAARQGFPVCSIVAPMAGSTAPAALAGALVQTVAESLAALVQIELMVPGASITVCMSPFISDLRTGSFSCGAAEVTLLNTAAGQMLNWYGLTGCISGGMTDAKGLDIQCGVEKGISAALTTLTNASNGGLIGLSTGLMGSLMAYSLEAVAIDNETLGTIQRLLHGIDVSEDTLSFDVIADVIKSGGHFLNHRQTLSVMRSEYFYPKLADRGGIEDWEKAGKTGISKPARKQVQDILSTHYPEYIDHDIDQRIRERFPVKLAHEEMRSGNSRW